MKTIALLFLAIAASGCPDIKTDPSDESPKGPTVEFDPANKIIPFPNNLLLDPASGKINLPAQCAESATAKALREGVLNKLDGFAAFEGAMTVTFTEPVDQPSLEASLVMYKRVAAGTAVDPASAQKIPVVVQITKTPRFDANCANPTMVDQAVVIPRVPLDQKSTYVVGLLDGVKTASGVKFEASFTWSLVRSTQNPAVFDDNGNYVSDRTPLDPNDPAQLEQLKGINLLWNAHAQGMKFLKDKGTDPNAVVLAWEFNTQTTTDPLDPAVTGSPASKVVEGLTPGQIPLLGNVSRGLLAAHPSPGVPRNPPFDQCPDTDNDVQCFLKISVGAGVYATGDARCAALNCAAINDVLGSLVGSKQYQIDTPNPYTGTGTKPVPGPWADPIKPAMVKSESIEVLSAVPGTPMPAEGYPVLIFQHGLGQSKTNAIAIAGRLAQIGIATVAIDAVGHDSRAVRISSTADAIPQKSCADVATSTRPDKGPSPVSNPQCYAPFLSPNLGTTRDGIRQTVLDQLRLIAAIKGCGITACGALKINPARIVYMGQSLGGIMGSVSVGLTTDLKAAVLNVPGVGWADILENTQNLQIRCTLVDGLIDAGILVGAKADNPAKPTTGLCITDAWKAQPGYRQFALIGRWILDPADPANYTRKLATKRIFIQEVVNDGVVPNVATDNEGALTALMPATADPATSAAPPPSAALEIPAMPAKNRWLRYPTLPPAAPAFPGNTFQHGSLLAPAATPGTDPPTVGNDGLLGTVRMQVDALAYLNANNP